MPFASNHEFNFHAKHDLATWRQFGGAPDADKRAFLSRPQRVLLPAGQTLYKPISVFDPLRTDNEPVWKSFYLTLENWNKLLTWCAVIEYFASVNIISPVYVWQGKTVVQGFEAEQLYVPNMDLNFRSHGKGLGFEFRRFAAGYVVLSIQS